MGDDLDIVNAGTVENLGGDFRAGFSGGGFDLMVTVVRGLHPMGSPEGEYHRTGEENECCDHRMAMNGSIQCISVTLKVTT